MYEYGPERRCNMHEVIITVAIARPDNEEISYVDTRVIRIEFDNEAALELWLNRCANGESPMMQGVTNIEQLRA
jgi:hypothetical protein